jgi:hypothetical protein
MDLGASSGLIFAQPEPGLYAIWGSAAWAQFQLTPGVSALAAPPPYMPVGARTEGKGKPINQVGVPAVIGGMHSWLTQPARLCKHWN